MSQAVQICAAAFRQANLDQDLVSFSTTQEFPYNIALDLINTVIQEMNRTGNLWFTESKTQLAYSVGTYSYDLSALSIDPKRIVRLRKEATNYWGVLKPYNWKHFQTLFRQAAIPTTQPMAFAKYAQTLELDVIPNQDYSIYVYHFKDMPLIANPADTLLLPQADEDVLQDGVYAYLLQRMGRPDFQAAYSVFLKKLTSLVQKTNEDAGLPSQMPASF